MPRVYIDARTRIKNNSEAGYQLPTVSSQHCLKGESGAQGYEGNKRRRKLRLSPQSLKFYFN